MSVMQSFEDALAALLGRAVCVLEPHTVPLLEAPGRVLARGVIAPGNVPAADTSAMDGYCVRAADIRSVPHRMPVSQRIVAGSVGAPLVPHTAARIFTGAPLPQGADAIVMQERCEHIGAEVVFNHHPAAFEWVRRAGEDIRQGVEVLSAGTRLRAQDVGLAASIGVASLPVYRRLKVGVFSTGNELVEPGQPSAPGAVFNSNRYVLGALLQSLGCEVTDLGAVPDDLDATVDALTELGATQDVVITSGGVSVGDEDHVKAALARVGQLDLWRVAIKPGKPLALGRVGAAAFIGLPGNPVSAFVTFVMLVRPFLLASMGVRELVPAAVSVKAAFDWPSPDPRREFLRARLKADGCAEIFPHQGSAALTSTAWAAGLVDVPPGTPIVRGQVIRYLPFSGLLG